MTNKNYENWAVGICIVRSMNGNFNADISKMPRRLPDKNGTIYATDKALKYCIRNYLVNSKKEKVFMWRRVNPEDKEMKPLSINENYEQLFEEVKNDTPREKILGNLLNCVDVRLFGCTYADKVNKRNVSVHGTTQISYGINVLQENTVYSNQILSPFRNPSEKSVEDTQATMGDESKALDVCYVYDYNINPNNISQDAKERLAKEDVEHFKEALCKGVNYVNTTTKIGSETLLVLYVELNKPKMLQNLKKFVEISKSDNSKLDIKLSHLVEYLRKFDSNISNAQIFYEKEKVSLINDEKWDKLKEFDLFEEKEE